MDTPILNAHNKTEYEPAHSAEHLLNATMVKIFGCPRSRNLMYSRNGKYLLTNAALLLFAEDVQRFHPNCRIRFVRYNGTEL